MHKLPMEVNMTYLDYINNTLSRKNEINWNYYGAQMRTDDILSGKASINFIKQYFENGGKVLPLVLNPKVANQFVTRYFTAMQKEFELAYRFDEQYQLPPERASHTVSGFFLGLFIENCINGTESLFLQSENHFPFSYLWFLTFLYHDYGYCVTERENCPIQCPNHAPIPKEANFHAYYISIQEYRALTEIKKVLGINLSPFSALGAFNFSSNSVPSLEHALLSELTQRNYTIYGYPKLHFSNGSVIRGHRYPSRVITRYFNYCINERHRVDHGIIGGFLFYDRMIKNYVLSYLDSNNEMGLTQDLSDFYYEKRHFFKEQLTVFSYISDCILSHNIFKQSTATRELYEKYLLIDLFEENFKTITFTSNPLLYILAISDTLEPIKVYQQCNANLTAQVIANAIDIEYIPGSHKLSFSSNSNEVDITVLHKKAMGLMDWTNAICSDLKNDAFTLIL